MSPVLSDGENIQLNKTTVNTEKSKSMRVKSGKSTQSIQSESTQSSKMSSVTLD